MRRIKMMKMKESEFLVAKTTANPEIVYYNPSSVFMQGNNALANAKVNEGFLQEFIKIWS